MQRKKKNIFTITTIVIVLIILLLVLAIPHRLTAIRTFEVKNEEQSGEYSLVSVLENKLVSYRVTDSNGTVKTAQAQKNGVIVELDEGDTIEYQNAKLEKGAIYNWDEEKNAGIYKAGTTVDSGSYLIDQDAKNDGCSYQISSSPNFYISDVKEEDLIYEQGEINLEDGDYLKLVDCQLIPE